MEKLIYLLWKRAEQPLRDWQAQLRGALGQRLIDAGAQSLQFNAVDDEVASGAGLRIISRPAPDGFVAFWLPSANYRHDCEELLRGAHTRIAGYLVTESCIKAGDEFRATGQRSQGFALIGFLQRPPRLSEAEWLKIWLDSHTQVAVDTQSTFRYVQNVVSRRLSDDAPPLDALVEEGFPIAALTDPQAFYAAVGDEQKYRRHLKMMMDSCNRFIDFDRIDSMPTSEYIVSAK